MSVGSSTPSAAQKGSPLRIALAYFATYLLLGLMLTSIGPCMKALEAQTGSLESGKWADMIAVDLGNLNTQPVFDPVSHLLYASGREHVTDVWVGGRHVVRTRQLTTGDGIALDRAVVSTSAAWQNRCRQLLMK